MSEKLKKIIDTNAKCYILYIFDIKHKECRLKPLYSIPKQIKLKDTFEMVNLDKPALYLNGRPVFILIRNYPSSIKLRFDTARKFLIGKGYSSSEMDSILNSTTFNSVFRKNVISIESILMIVLMVISAIVITMLVYSIIIIPTIETQYIYIVNGTRLENIWSLN